MYEQLPIFVGATPPPASPTIIEKIEPEETATVPFAKPPPPPVPVPVPCVAPPPPAPIKLNVAELTPDGTVQVCVSPV